LPIDDLIRGAQDLVPSHDDFERSLQGLYVDLSTEPVRRWRVVRKATGSELVDKPEELLRVR
jgi:hypothetical protein